MPVSDRRVALEGPLNFRDVGGYTGADGRHVRWGRVFRSDSLHHLTEADGPRLAKIGIKTALDFRAHDELDRIGIGHLGNLDIKHVHVPTVDKVLHVVRPPDWKPLETVGEIYLLMMESGASAYAAALRTLVESDSLPAVYYCMAGKDRTGVFSAVLLGLLGVSDLDIVADYALTHEVVEKIHERGRAELPEEGAAERAEIWKNVPEDLLGAHAASMEGLIEGMHARYDSWAGYAAAIGVEDDVVQTLRDTLLEAQQ
ncbi:MAG: tyrosine-protein phosphatase [Actinobacteria bacterium]|nr:tyrosine-protein phosphatase [Actinomycetota bacterium]